MTDSEIIKALKDKINGSDYQGFEDDDVLNLIVRQQAEINSLRADLKRICAERDAHMCTNNFIKSEAYKEFANQIKMHKRKMRGFDLDYEFWDFAVSVEDIDILLNEMVGEE